MAIIEVDLSPKEMRRRLLAFMESQIFPGGEKRLLSEEIPIADQIALLEMGRKYAIEIGVDLAELVKYEDFAEICCDRRPDPIFDQWLYLYRNIGCRHPNLSVESVCEIMAGRDSLLPFLESAPDIRFQNHYEKFFGECNEDGSSPLPYPKLEEAVKNDSPAKVSIYQMMCREVDRKQIMERAVFLEKAEVAASLLKAFSPDEKCRKLIKMLRYWEKPEKLLQKALPAFGSELVSWQDAYGNGFFWYLYSCGKEISREMIDALPEELIATFEKRNCYGLAPCDLWPYYRTALHLPREDVN